MVTITNPKPVVPKSDVPLSGTDFGITVNDPNFNNAPRLQEFFDTLKSDKRAGTLPEGILYISDQIAFEQINGWNLTGRSSGTNDEGARTVIRWNGLAGGTMALFSGVRNGTLENIVLDGDGIAGIGFDYDAILGGLVSTLNKFTQLYVQNCTDKNVRIGKSGHQTDQTDWYSCVFRNGGTAVSIEDANAVWHQFFGGEVHGNGIGITAAQIGDGGHFDLTGVKFVGQTVHDIQVYPGRATIFTAVKSEGSHRFLEGPTSNSSAAWPVTLQGCDVNGITAADQQGIRWQSISPLIIKGGRYRSGQTNLPFKIKMPSSGGTLIGTVIAEGVAFPEGNPWNVAGNLGGIIRAEHCTYTAAATGDTVPSVSGYLPRLTSSSASALTTDPTTAPSSEKATRHWVRVLSGTALVAGENAFFVKSPLCKGNTSISIVAWRSHGGTNAAASLLGATVYDDHAVNPNTARLIFRTSGAVTTNADITICIQYEPEPVTY